MRADNPQTTPPTPAKPQPREDLVAALSRLLIALGRRPEVLPHRRAACQQVRREQEAKGGGH